MKKKGYVLGSIGEWTVYGIGIGILITVIMMFTTDFARYEGSFLEGAERIFSVMLMLGGGFWFLVMMYTFYFLEMPAMLAMGATRKEIFRIQILRMLAVSLLLGGVIWLEQLTFGGNAAMPGFQIAGNAFLIMVTAGSAGNILGCIQFRFGKIGFICFILLCGGMGAVYGALNAIWRKGESLEMGVKITAEFGGASLAAAAAIALAASGVLSFFIMRKADVRA